ncbi:hypothetical protein Pmani_012419 [Petrolisthes manimaculis]|uniref:Uncharacterized protein n=1 Tax=Petrolisthes manimaculis TaxID=1843537 RepID=A0AAE1PY07_9EUCA|nr:hypothetical protein Pmani_012419 [Petrolisthes manimaculis]
MTVTTTTTSTHNINTTTTTTNTLSVWGRLLDSLHQRYSWCCSPFLTVLVTSTRAPVRLVVRGGGGGGVLRVTYGAALITQAIAVHFCRRKWIL